MTAPIFIRRAELSGLSKGGRSLAHFNIYVNVPATYHEEPQKKYPALFTLDADYSFALAKQSTEHLSDRNHIGAKETRGNGSEFPMVDDMQEFVTVLQNRKYKNFKIKSVVFADESHDTVFPAALTRGIMFVFGR